jgi:hypothetical protein
MKKQTLFSIIFIATLMVFSMVLTTAVFAGSSTHTITIVNNSNTALIPTQNSHRVIYTSTNPACGTVPPDTCATVDMTPPSTIAAGGSAVVNMTGPTGCNIAMWQTYYAPGKGKYGEIQCAKSPVNVCNSVTKNYTCTISQQNVDDAKANKNAVPAVQ